MKDFYSEKKVLVTGHTGFKGAWLSLWLSKMGATVYGLSNNVPSNPSAYEQLSLSNKILDNRADITDFSSCEALINDINPDIIFHLAAQALVRRSYADPLETIYTNAIGTSNLLEILRKRNKATTVVLITSDKVYDNVEWIWGYKETDVIGGKDPYSASKGMAELAIKTYINSYFNNDESNISIGVTRAGNVIGGGDWAIDRIVPDCIKAWSRNDDLEVRSPNATRPWQHVLEPLSGYLHLGRKLHENPDINGQAFNFGPMAANNYSVSQLIDHMKIQWGDASWFISDAVNSNQKEAGLLKLNCDKALSMLDWIPCLNFHETVDMTVEWYKKSFDTVDMGAFSSNQIDIYEDLARTRANYFD